MSRHRHTEAAEGAAKASCRRETALESCRWESRRRGDADRPGSESRTYIRTGWPSKLTAKAATCASCFCKLTCALMVNLAQRWYSCRVWRNSVCTSN